MYALMALFYVALVETNAEYETFQRIIIHKELHNEG